MINPILLKVLKLTMKKRCDMTVIVTLVAGVIWSLATLWLIIDANAKVIEAKEMRERTNPFIKVQ